MQNIIQKLILYSFVFIIFLSSCIKHGSNSLVNTEESLSGNLNLFGSIQSSDVHFVYPPKNSLVTTIKNIAEEGTILKKGDFIAELTPQKNNDEILNNKQKIDSILQDNVKNIQEINSTIQKNLNEINKSQSDIEIFNRTRGKKSIDVLAEFIPLNELKKEAIENKENITKVNNLRTQNYYLTKKLSIYKNNYEQRLNILQKNSQTNINKDKFIVTADANGILFFRKNWQGEKYTKSSTIYEDVAFARIENTEKMQAISYLPEENRNNVSIGKKVKVVIFGSQNIEVVGSIHAISKIVMSLKNWDRDLDKGKPSSVDPLYFKILVSLDSLPTTIKPATKVQVLL